MSHIEKYFLKKNLYTPGLGNCAIYFKKMSDIKVLGVMT